MTTTTGGNYFRQGPPLWKIGALTQNFEQSTEKNNDIDEFDLKNLPPLNNVVFGWLFDKDTPGSPIPATKDALNLKSQNCYLMLRIFKRDANAVKNADLEACLSNKSLQSSTDSTQSNNDTNNTDTKQTKPLNNNESEIPPLSIKTLADCAKSVISPRGLKMIFGSLPRDELSSSLFATNSHQSFQCDYELYIWNGTDASAMVRANCLAKSFALERLLHATNSTVCRLFAGQWHGASSLALPLVSSDGLARRTSGSHPLQDNALLLALVESPHDAAKGTSRKCTEARERRQHLFEKAPPPNQTDKSGTKHARIADDSVSKAKKKRPSRPTNKRVTGKGANAGKASSTTLPAPQKRPLMPALRLPLAGLRTAKTDDELPTRGRPRPGGNKNSPASKSFSLMLPKDSRMRLMLDQQKQEEEEEQNDKPLEPIYSKSELLRLYDPICSKILDWMYLGSRCPAMSRDQLKSFGITHILNCAGTIVDNYFPKEFEYLALALVDGSTEDMECLFYYVLEWFEEIRIAGGSVYVHCHAGISRSSTFVICYLMWKNNWPFLKTHEHVKAIRQTVNPNGGFIGQLLEWWKRTHSPSPRPPRLYRVIMHSLDPNFLVPKHVKKVEATSLDPRTSFVLHLPDKVYAWHGSKALPRYRNATIAIHKRLVRFEAAPSNLIAIEQGQEPEEFWQILGGKAPVAAVADYNKDYSPAMLNAVKPESLLNKDLVEDLGIQSDSPRATLYLYPNNFLIDTITASDFERVYSDELESNCLYLLLPPSKDTVFAWIGNKFNPPGGEPAEQFGLDALKAFKKLHPNMFQKTPKFVTVLEGGNESRSEEFYDVLDSV